MKKKTSKRGGARVGAGRKATGRKPQVCISLPRELLEFMDAAPEGRGAFIARLIEAERRVASQELVKTLERLLSVAQFFDRTGAAAKNAEKILSAIRGK